MFYTKWSTLCLTAILACGASAAASAASPPVVLELFTSNSCSSCPPAYTLLHRLQRGTAPAHAKLIRLDEHVDYWNQLDWVDQYSDAQFSRRQRDYARAVFGANHVFTPQLVVDGMRDMVGSNGPSARRAIRALATQASLPVSLQVKSGAGRRIEVQVDTGQAPSNKTGQPGQVWVALTQDGVVSHVGAGENGGRTLHEDGVVRWLQPVGRIGASASGGHYTAKLKLPKQVADADLNVVAFVQQDRSHSIVGAASRPLTALNDVFSR